VGADICVCPSGNVPFAILKENSGVFPCLRWVSTLQYNKATPQPLPELQD